MQNTLGLIIFNIFCSKCTIYHFSFRNKHCNNHAWGKTEHYRVSNTLMFKNVSADLLKKILRTIFMTLKKSRKTNQVLTFHPILIFFFLILVLKKVYEISFGTIVKEPHSEDHNFRLLLLHGKLCIFFLQPSLFNAIH